MALLDTLLQSIVLSVVSNILAQMISAYQEHRDLLSIDPVPIGQFIIYTIINVPINVYWQTWLEKTFPGNKKLASAVTSEKSGKKSIDTSDGKTQLDIKNTLIKFAMDQTVGACINIPLFLATIGAVQGKSANQILTQVQADGWDIYKAGAKLWPAVSLISFVAIPVERRVIFGSIAGVAWNIYLSLKASK